MLERLEKRASDEAARRAEALREALAGRLREVAPAGVRISVEGDDVVLVGRGLSRRVAGDPGFRWLVVEARDG